MTVLDRIVKTIMSLIELAEYLQNVSEEHASVYGIIKVQKVAA